jgi:hypothetical protein
MLCSSCPTSGFYSLRVSVSSTTMNYTEWKLATLMGFTSLGSSSFLPANIPRNPSSHGLINLIRISATALQSLASRKFSLTLSSLLPLPRFATLLIFLILYDSSASGLPLRDRPVLPLSCIPSLKRFCRCRSSSGESRR